MLLSLAYSSVTKTKQNLEMLQASVIFPYRYFIGDRKKLCIGVEMSFKSVVVLRVQELVRCKSI